MATIPQDERINAIFLGRQVIGSEEVYPIGGAKTMKPGREAGLHLRERCHHFGGLNSQGIA